MIAIQWLDEDKGEWQNCEDCHVETELGTDYRHPIQKGVQMARRCSQKLPLLKFRVTWHGDPYWQEGQWIRYFN